MTFLRRGNVAFPHRFDAEIRVHRYGGHPLIMYLKDVSCFEEYQFNASQKIVKIYFTNGSNVMVIEDFDAVLAACREWEVANV